MGTMRTILWRAARSRVQRRGGPGGTGSAARGAVGAGPAGARGGGRQLIGITADVAEVEGLKARAQCGMAYVRAVAAAGGLPLILPPVAELAAEFAARCDAVLFTGGADPRMEQFGAPTHPEAKT